ncbi:DNA-formamidopyrimidine glycosylase [Synechococcus sp. PCC 6312]|uniref:DNA-formamidopyrimidine glycosylase n=1 Tax=Synechococcus sp. (strain ATCC 27167 / PCC 6312) TaxID=195253 RepID=UPI00029EF737|nr:DNA-formamidopyrimidine glycosylase [Synechococcus sp. PCC 6312]AFY61772.1 formamidopyrimidine-DNA glycosylase Fpg [Synechococcus sp. PCC 6312]
MPELPEVETVRRGLAELTLDVPILGGEVLYPKTVAYPLDPDEFISGLVGQSLQAWERRGKYLIGKLNSRGWLVVHLRMTGQLFWLSQEIPMAKHTRVRLFFGSGQELRFVDQRTFGQMWWLPAADLLPQLMPTLAGLGPEPLGPDFTVSYLAQKLQHPHKPIKNALLDQALIAGIGNIYADEALFLAQIHPQARCCDLTPVQIQTLHQKIKAVLQLSLAVGGTTFNTFTSVEGINGNYGGQAWVYGRKGQPCRVCQTPIQQIRLGGRSAHFCPQCQPLTN